MFLPNQDAIKHHTIHRIPKSPRCEACRLRGPVCSFAHPHPLQHSQRQLSKQNTSRFCNLQVESNPTMIGPRTNIRDVNRTTYTLATRSQFTSYFHPKRNTRSILYGSKWSRQPGRFTRKRSRRTLPRIGGGPCRGKGGLCKYNQAGRPQSSGACGCVCRRGRNRLRHDRHMRSSASGCQP